jgi:hypothetical protein
MPLWITKLRNKVLGGKSDSIGNGAPPPSEALREQATPAEKPAPPPPAATPKFADTLVALTPISVFGVGLLLTVFAERLGNWAVLGFLLVAGSPLLYFLRRIELRIVELIEATKSKRR